MPFRACAFLDCACYCASRGLISPGLGHAPTGGPASVEFCTQPPWNLTIRAPLLSRYVSAYNARLLRFDSGTLLATFQVSEAATTFPVCRSANEALHAPS